MKINTFCCALMLFLLVSISFTYALNSSDVEIDYNQISIEPISVEKYVDAPINQIETFDIVTEDGTNLVKTSLNQLKVDSLTVESSNDLIFMGDINEKEWGYLYPGTDTISCQDGCVVIYDNYICDNKYSDIGKERIFENCYYYPPVYSLDSNDSLVRIKQYPYQVEVTYNDNYDPRATSVGVLLDNLTVISNHRVTMCSGNTSSCNATTSFTVSDADYPQDTNLVNTTWYENIAQNKRATAIWDFNTPRATDVTGNNFNGTLSGFTRYDACLGSCSSVADTAEPTLVNSTSGFGTAYRFDGVNDYLTLNSVLNNSPSRSFTWTLKLKSFEEGTRSNFSILGGIMGNKVSTGLNGCQLLLLNNTGNKGRLSFGCANTTSTSSSITGSIINNRLYSIAARYNSSNFKQDLYLDNILNASSNSIRNTFGSTINFMIGRFYTSYYFNGTIDEPRIYSCALTQSQIQADSISPYPLDIPNCPVIASWSFTEKNTTHTMDTNYLVAGANKGDGGTYRFNGVSSKITRTALSSIDKNKDFTVSIWFKNNQNYSSTYRTIFENQITGTDFGINIGNVSGNSQIITGIYDGSSHIYKKSLTTGNKIFRNIWYNIVIVYKNNTYFNLYLNGINQSGNTQAQLSTVNGMSIGSSSNSNRFFNGTIDDVMIWNYSLSSSQILENYNAFLANRTPRLMSSETAPGQTWTSKTRTTDGYAYSIISEKMFFINYLSMVKPVISYLSKTYNSIRINSTSRSGSKYLLYIHDENTANFTSFPYNITGLSPYTQYHIAVKAYNTSYANNPSELSDELEVTTYSNPIQTPAPVIINISQTWQSIEINASSKYGQYYKLYINGINTHNFSTFPLNITELQNVTTYKISVKAYSDQFTTKLSLYSNNLTVTTPQSPEYIPPTSDENLAEIVRLQTLMQEDSSMLWYTILLLGCVVFGYYAATHGNFTFGMPFIIAGSIMLFRFVFLFMKSMWYLSAVLVVLQLSMVVLVFNLKRHRSNMKILKR